MTLKNITSKIVGHFPKLSRFPSKYSTVSRQNLELSTNYKLQIRKTNWFLQLQRLNKQFSLIIDTFLHKLQHATSEHATFLSNSSIHHHQKSEIMKHKFLSQVIKKNFYLCWRGNFRDGNWFWCRKQKELSINAQMAHKKVTILRFNLFPS